MTATVRVMMATVMATTTSTLITWCYENAREQQTRISTLRPPLDSLEPSSGRGSRANLQRQQPAQKCLMTRSLWPTILPSLQSQDLQSDSSMNLQWPKSFAAHFHSVAGPSHLQTWRSRLPATDHASDRRPPDRPRLIPFLSWEWEASTRRTIARILARVPVRRPLPRRKKA
jgi:hypothetical protein